MKLVTPILHLFFLIPMTGITVGIEMFVRKIGILGEYQGVIDLPIIITFFCGIIVFGIPIFWLVNILMQRIEKLRSPKVTDYIRQSVLLFMAIFYIIITWFVRGFSGGEEDGYLLLWLGISIIAVMINFIFLFHRSGVTEA